MAPDEMPRYGMCVCDQAHVRVTMLTAMRREGWGGRACGCVLVMEWLGAKWLAWPSSPGINARLATARARDRGKPRATGVSVPA